jgi:peptidoglycan/xylan/chitin deacetylase (PgdA/CDA1 family)
MLAAALAVAALSTPAQALEIALTYDDLPSHSVLPAGDTWTAVAARLVAGFKEAGVTEVYGFVNGAYTERDPASVGALKVWRAAGYPLANHTWSHTSLNNNSAEAWKQDLVRNEPLLQQQMGDGDWRWLRYPNLHEGDTPEKRADVRRFLAERGYKIASVTMSFNDYAFNAPYARCVAKGDGKAIADLEARYLHAAEESLKYSRAMSKALYGRDIPYVLLMHSGALDARLGPRLLAMYKAHGAKFVTLEAAQAHPFYRQDTVIDPAAAEPATLEAAMKARGLTPPERGWNLQGLDTTCR